MNKAWLVVAVVVAVCCVRVESQNSPVLRASIAVGQLQTWYSYLKGSWSGVGWWHSANCMTALAEFSERTGNHSFDHVYSSAYPINSVFFVEGYDDEGWWALAWLDAYRLTQHTAYLDLAEAIFNDMSKAWDTTCGGGVWWDRKKTYKNAITNELFLAIAGQLYLFTKDDKYLKWAQQEWAWFSTVGIINPQNLINDGLANCKNNGGTPWTYNQGVVLGGLATLYNITRDQSLLDWADKIANATIAHLTTPQGILQETCDPSGSCNADAVQFKGIFMRNLAQLYKASKNPYHASFILKNADSIWNSARKGNSFGARWSGPFDSSDAARQSSALDAFNAVLVL